jgi:glyoxylase I family protein
MNMHIHHICIQTNDYEASKQFYINLGFSLHKETAGFHSRDFNTWLQLGDFYIELQTAKTNETLRDFHKQSTGIVHFCLYTDDFKKEITRLEQLNVPFQQKDGSNIYFVENGFLAKIIAPEGTIIEVRDSKIL